MLRLLFPVLALCCIADSARAQTAFMMTPSVETDRIAPDIQARVLKATRDALRAHGIGVVPRDDAPRSGVECASRDCVAETLDTLKADFGVYVNMMASPEADGALGSVGIAFYHRDLVYSGVSVRVLDKGIDRAIDETFRAAREAQRRGPGPWLIVHGAPPDTEIYLEGVRIDDGDLPCAARVPPSQMLTLIGVREGYRSREYHLTGASDPASTQELQVALSLEENATYPRAVEPRAAWAGGAGEARDGRAGPTRSVATWRDWTLGAALVVVGALVTIHPLRTLIHADERPYADPNRRVQPGPRTGGLLALGGAVVLGGITIPLVIKPFGVRVTTSPTGAALNVHQSF